jgi:membrane fusion protein, multidrug efflux system
MKLKWISLTFIVLILVASCGEKDVRNQINRLESQKLSLQKKIAEIDNQLLELQSQTNDSQISRVVPVYVQEIVEERFVNYFSVQGNVTSDNNILIPAEHSGVIKNVYFEEGDFVESGTILAEIDNSLLLKQKLEIETSLDLANTSYERQKRLWEQEIGSEMQYLQAKNQKETLESRLETLNEQIKKTYIKAPISGNLDKVFIKKGEIIQMGLQAFQIVQLSKLKIEAEVSEKYVADIQKGDSVLVSFSGVDTEFKSSISAVSQVINPDSRTFTIEVKVPEKLDYIKPNMLSMVKIYNYENPKAITIPMNVIQKNEKGNFVFIAKKDGDGYYAERRTVTIAQNNKNRVEINDGVEVGELLITDGYQNISNEQGIEIVK